MNKLEVLFLGSLVFYSCATNNNYLDEFLSSRSAAQSIESLQTVENRLDVTNPLDLEQLVVPERRYTWTGEKHITNSVSWYNPSLKTLDTGLQNGDLVVVLNKDNEFIVADEAKVKFYSDIKSMGNFKSEGEATIEYRIGERWFETVPSDPEGNIDLLHSELGGVYRTIDSEALQYWPEDPFAALLYEPDSN